MDVWLLGPSGRCWRWNRRKRSGTQIMTTNSKVAARRLLRDAITKEIFPELHRVRMKCFLENKGGPPSWFFCRKRADHGFDVLAIKLHEGHATLFDAFICVLPPDRVEESRGELICVDDTTVINFPDQVAIVSRLVKNRVLRTLARSWGIGWFGFKPRNDVAYNKQAAMLACAKFIECLEQAERWWRDGLLGPNLVITRSEPKSESNGKPKGSASQTGQAEKR